VPLPLPIDTVLPELLAALRTSGRAVLEAPPGAGKTTRVPLALYEQAKDDPREIVVTEPRRLAARLAANHVAKSLGESVGNRVGYSVRFDEKRGPRTRVRYVTEGTLLQELRREPTLKGVRAVILDEFHERHLESDQLLALLWRLVQSRSDLQLLVMSATLDAGSVSDFLNHCPRISSEGRAYPVTIEYDTELQDRPLERRVSLAVKKALRASSEGHVLVFLPGAREIAQVAEQLAPVANDLAIQLLPLHGELPLEAQSRAVEPSQQRKVVLATNVAESSVTIDGVRAVVDSGLARIASVSPWTGRRTLEVLEVSQDSATQRAGRAGRTGPGHVVRLFGEGNYKARPKSTPPEVVRSDLTELVLAVHGLGFDPRTLEWLDAPPSAALQAAERLLQQLGALTASVDGKTTLTPLGSRLLELPLPPRLGRVFLEGRRLGIAASAALAVTLLASPDIRERRRERDPNAEGGLSDLQERIDVYRQAEEDRFSAHSLRSLGLLRRTVEEVSRSVQKLRGRSDEDELNPFSDEAETALRKALLAGFVDHVAKRKAPDSDQLTLANGSRLKLAPHSVVHSAPFLVVLDQEERIEHAAANNRGWGALARWVSAIDPEWLLDDYSEAVSATETLLWNPSSARVENSSRLSVGSVLLDETVSRAQPSPATTEVLFNALLPKLATLLNQNDSLASWQARLALLQSHGLVAAEENIDGPALLKAACQTASSQAEVQACDFHALLLAQLSSKTTELLRREAPEQLTLPGGRRLNVHYEAGKPPWVESRLQDFFGLRETPALCRGQVPLTLHLLAPNQRAVQVTSDLKSFWQRHYPEIRRELCRRYPRHAWPEDGASATPPEPKLPRPRR
jgi:ATP-dependent helicase HrpB